MYRRNALGNSIKNGDAEVKDANVAQTESSVPFLFDGVWNNNPEIKGAVCRKGKLLPSRQLAPQTTTSAMVTGRASC